MIADTSSLKIYLDGGRKVLSTRFYPDSGQVALHVHGISLRGWHLNGMEVDIPGKFSSLS